MEDELKNVKAKTKCGTIVESIIKEPVKKRIGVYSGSFDPITLGHLDIIKKSVKEFDEVIIAMLVNPDKKGLFTIEERLYMIKQVIKAENLQCVTVEAFNGMFVDFMKNHNATASVRGLRTSEDFIYEQNIYMVNKDFSDDFETHCFMANPLMLHCSSSTVKGLLPYTTDIGHYIHDSIKDYLIDAYKKKK